MNDLPRCDRMYDALPSDDEGECSCGSDLNQSNGSFECSACGVTICEYCAIVGQCRNDACENVYCEKCAPKWLPAENGGCCAHHDNVWRYHAAQHEQFFAAAVPVSPQQETYKTILDAMFPGRTG